MSGTLKKNAPSPRQVATIKTKGLAFWKDLQWLGAVAKAMGFRVGFDKLDGSETFDGIQLTGKGTDATSTEPGAARVSAIGSGTVDITITACEVLGISVAETTVTVSDSGTVHIWLVIDATLDIAGDGFVRGGSATSVSYDHGSSVPDDDEGAAEYYLERVVVTDGVIGSNAVGNIAGRFESLYPPSSEARLYPWRLS